MMRLSRWSVLAVAAVMAASAATAASKNKDKKAAAAKKEAAGGGSVVMQVYTEYQDPNNHFIPSGWMGDYSDLNFRDAETTRPRAGKYCIKMGYKAKGGAGWGGIYWQTPANNWGNVEKAGFDLSKAKKLTFWARGEKGGEVITKVKVGGISGNFPDSDDVTVEGITLTDQWTQHTVDLAGKNLTKIIGGFCVVFAKNDNPDGATIYLDDILFQ